MDRSGAGWRVVQRLPWLLHRSGSLHSHQDVETHGAAIVLFGLRPCELSAGRIGWQRCLQKAQGPLLSESTLLSVAALPQHPPDHTSTSILKHAAQQEQGQHTALAASQ